MNWASLAISIVAALGAALAAHFAYVATRDSGRANNLAAEANDLAKKANEQQERFFSESGALISINFFGPNDYHKFIIRVMSTGRLAATIQDIQLVFLSSGFAFAGRDIIEDLRLPFALRQTELRDVSVDPYVLAPQTGAYGGSHQWQASAVLGDSRSFSSAAITIRHPDEPRLGESPII